MITTKKLGHRGYKQAQRSLQDRKTYTQLTRSHLHMLHTHTDSHLQINIHDSPQLKCAVSVSTY